MTVERLDHFTINTTDVPRSVEFYTDVLGLRDGDRPAFNFPGAWLYCGDHAAVHLVEVADSPEVPLSQTSQAPRIEHFAFRAENLAQFLAHLRALDVAYRTTVVPDLEIRQGHLHDPEGNHIEIAFGPNEEAELGDYPGG